MARKHKACRVCGCTEHAACIDPQTHEGCHWLRTLPDMCSACLHSRFARALDLMQTHQKNIRAGRTPARFMAGFVNTYQADVRLALHVAVQAQRLSDLLIEKSGNARDAEIGHALQSILAGKGF
jgi:hypothetical protein